VRVLEAVPALREDLGLDHSGPSLDRNETSVGPMTDELQKYWRSNARPRGKPRDMSLPPIKVVNRDSLDRDKKFKIIFGALRRIADTPPDRRKKPRNDLERVMLLAAEAVEMLVKGVK